MEILAPLSRDPMNNIEITSNYYFRPWMMAASMLFLLFSIAFPLNGAFLTFVFTPLTGFILALCGFFQFAVICFSKELFEYNPQTKQYRKGIKLFDIRQGEWKAFDLTNASRIAFQKYEETINYNFGGIFHPHAEADIYELRLIRKDDTFESITNGSDLKSIAKMVTLGNVMSQTLGLPFYDYIRDMVSKRRVE